MEQFQDHREELSCHILIPMALHLLLMSHGNQSYASGNDDCLTHAKAANWGFGEKLVIVVYGDVVLGLLRMKEH